jgi:hypothetical protein
MVVVEEVEEEGAKEENYLLGMWCEDGVVSRMAVPVPDGWLISSYFKNG